MLFSLFRSRLEQATLLSFPCQRLIRRQENAIASSVSPVSSCFIIRYERFYETSFISCLSKFNPIERGCLAFDNDWIRFRTQNRYGSVYQFRLSKLQSYLSIVLYYASVPNAISNPARSAVSERNVFPSSLCESPPQQE
ncbi:unnamed protein product [Amoebophrya sp. A120]|nr:unnamed protein product [Amoebophrya sp. A120]|eukprot:GSA120T00003609001.1